jgi:uncharacterized protein (TIGR02448 family)
MVRAARDDAAAFVASDGQHPRCQARSGTAQPARKRRCAARRASDMELARAILAQ